MQAPSGRRRRFISKAVLHYVESQGRRSLKERLKAGCQANAAEASARRWSGFRPRVGMPKISRRHQRQEVSGLRRGDVCLVSFDPTVGHEIRKTRPALVIQNDVGNQFSPLTIVAAIASKVSPEPFPVEVVVAPSRVLNRLGAIDAVSMRMVDEAIKISLGLIEI
jgi:mRNA interferase MazF